MDVSGSIHDLTESSNMQKVGLLMAAGAVTCAAALPAMAVPGAVAVKQLAPTPGVTLDYANATPMPLPRTSVAPGSRVAAATMSSGATSAARKPGSSPGGQGDGVTAPVRLFSADAKRAASESGVEPDWFGSSKHVFTTSRANIESMVPSKGYPFTAVGRLFFNIDGLTYVCSASLIKPGVVVTAAHCVSRFGTNTYYTDFQYVPVYSEGRAPFGVWAPQAVIAPAGYLDGSTPCTPSAPGVVCQDDMAVIVLEPRGGKFAGKKTGWLGYAWDGKGFSTNNEALITQLGYPVDLDKGEIMQRNDSEGFTDPDSVNNTVIGSMMTGGSSGGPWVANWGLAPKAPGFLDHQPEHNQVVGVTSWGYTFPTIKEQGAAPFLSTNIVPLVNAACAQVPAACATSD